LCDSLAWIQQRRMRRRRRTPRFCFRPNPSERIGVKRDPRGFCFVAQAATWPSLPLRSATASEQQSTSAPGRRLTWPPVRESGSLRLSRRGAPLGHCRPSQASIRTPPSGRNRSRDAARGQRDRHDRNVAEALARGALPEPAKAIAGEHGRRRMLVGDCDSALGPTRGRIDTIAMSPKRSRDASRQENQSDRPDGRSRAIASRAMRHAVSFGPVIGRRR
jgi:hypothetical protein